METNEKRIKPKVNSKDNTININIKKVKDNWNRNEVTLLCEKAMKYGWENSEYDSDQWIKQNL